MTSQELTAETVIRHQAAAIAVRGMCRDHEDHRLPVERGNEWRFRMHYGSVILELDDQDLKIRVSAADETDLSYMRMIVAGHVREYLDSAVAIRWSGDGGTSSIPVFFREITVMSSERISPHMQRLRFSARDIGRFAVGGIHLRLLIPPRGRKPVWPTIGEDGLLVWPQGEDALTVRIYTIQAIDVEKGFVDIDFVLHPGLETPAAKFAQTAKPGEVIGMIGPGGEHVPDGGHLILLGDDTAIPAISRILRELPEGRTADVWIEVDGPGDILPLKAETASVRWLFRKGRPAGTTGLLSDAVRKIDPKTLPEDIFVWSGSEFTDFKEIRRIVRKEWGLAKDRQLIVAYWRRGAQGDDARSEAA